jgi:hypothetical protein
MARMMTLMALVLVTIALVLTVVACETQHVDQNFGTDAGADFDAPAREVHPDTAD